MVGGDKADSAQFPIDVIFQFRGSDLLSSFMNARIGPG